MSTLRVTTIQDTAGANSSTTSAIANGIAKAWVNFNGTGTVAIRQDFNVTSVTDAGVGSYRVNFTTAMPDANYAAVVSTTESSTRVNEPVAPTTTTLSIQLQSPSDTQVDGLYVSAAVFR